MADFPVISNDVRTHLDWHIVAGDTSVIVLSLKNEVFQLLDITTWTFKAQVREQRNRTSTLIATPFVIKDNVLSTCTLALSASQTGDIPAGNYYWDLQVTTTTGVVVTYAHGLFTVLNDVTV